MSETDQTKVAIACQGGGSHTAFTAGVLDRLLEEHRSDYRITAFSGTSGGAVCALAAWYGLRTGTTPAAGDKRARELLEQVWDDIKSQTYAEQLTNRGLVQIQRFAEMGFPVPQIAPDHNPFAPAGEKRFRAILEGIADEDAIEELVQDLPKDDSTDPPEAPDQPWLYVSAVDAINGSFEIFSDWPEDSRNPTTRAMERPHKSGTHTSHASTEEVPFRALYRELLTDVRRPLTLDAVAASAAVPTLFRGVRLGNDDESIYWDGLFSQNPPVRNLLRGIEDRTKKPDEIWLIRINPTVHERELDDLEDIFDRRNELAGSLSLYQELYHIRRVNQWVTDGKLRLTPADDSEDAPRRYKPITVRLIELDEGDDQPFEELRKLTPASKLDRRPEFIEQLKTQGRTQADQFLASYRQGVKENVIVDAEPEAD
ncbi:patatin-like phospholipase family protein [Natrinema sp. SYSU A 869]|uniref:patatin-like phospholipase family protein n=1 Tax=Natrinema sp. SYSU A 869 TaxID=2871694 RepID=UPI001CA3C92E|nr:patatin-like phospholipase family protein [Natrinema sp. SYSU A 869]